MQKYIYTLLAVASMALTACNEHNIPTPAELPTPGKGRTVTITATTGDNPDTRISYQEDDDNTSTNILWSEGDNFYLCYSDADPDAAYLFEKDDDDDDKDESSTANFTCTELPENLPSDVTLYAIYPGNSEIKANATNLAIDFSTQDGKATGKHLMLAKLESNTIDDWDGIRFSFETNVALLKLTLKNEDFKGIVITNITVKATNLCGESVFKFEDQSWANETSGSITINAPITGDDEGNVTVYIAQPKSDKSTGLISISATCGGNLYSGTLDEGMFEEYCVYTAEVDMLPSMQFTVKPAAYQTKFTFPFTDITGNYTLMIDWGDGSEITTIRSGTETTDDLLSHAYANTDGTYTITLTTTAPYTEEQMPGGGFSRNNSELMLVSMDSPMLNTASTDFSYCFYGCSNLTTIPDGLFSNNTAAENFDYSFYACSELTTIPDKLFETNTAATNFEYCFLGCFKLTTIPDGLFSNNIAAEIFDFCFADCTSLETIPAGLFAKNTGLEFFNYCFAGCTSLTTIPAGLFDYNLNVSFFDFCFADCTSLATIPAGLFAYNLDAFSFYYCFSNCTNLETIPAGLFAKNTAAGIFSSCFEGCSNLQLNPDIFCDERAEQDSRFAGKSVDFSYCFNGVGYSLESDEGGTAPALWEYEFGAVEKRDCFKDCTKVENYKYIQDDWKGL